MPAPSARYDGYADWYDETFGGLSVEDARILSGLLGPGNGDVCLDIACGTGRLAAPLHRTGYSPVGIDLSADQLRIAKTRMPAALVRGDVTRMPFRTRSVSRAAGLYFHSDVEDFGAVLREVARCLVPSGRFAYIGVHPCFVGAFVDRAPEQEAGRLEFRPGYGEEGWSAAGSFGGTGVRIRVGFHHKTLATFLSAFIDAGFYIQRVVELEGGGQVLPRNIAVLAAKP